MDNKRPRPSMWNSHTVSVSEIAPENGEQEQPICNATESCDLPPPPPAAAPVSPNAIRRHALRDMPTFVPLMELYSIRYSDLQEAEQKLQRVYSGASENHIRRLYDLSRRAAGAAADNDWNLIAALWAEAAMPNAWPALSELTVGEIHTMALTAKPKTLAEQACALFLYPFADDLDAEPNRVALADRVARSLIYSLERLQPLAGEGEAALEMAGADRKLQRIARYRLRAEEEYVFGVHNNEAVFAQQKQPVSTTPRDPLVARFRFERVLGSGSYGIAFLAETLTSTWPTMQRRRCTIKAEIRPDDTEARVAYELTKAYSPRRLQNYQTNFVRLYTWSRSISDITALRLPPQSLPPQQADTVLREFIDQLLMKRGVDAEGPREWVYTAMEYADGGTLSHFARANPDLMFRDAECFRGLMLQLVCMLAELNDRFQFVHGDLHTANVLLVRAPPDDPRLEALDYRVGGLAYQVHLRRCAGRIVKISDYGRSRLRFGNLEARTPDSNARSFEYDLHLLALSLLDVLYGVTQINGLRLESVSGSVWQFLRLCIIREFDNSEANETAQSVFRYLGRTRESLDFSDEDFDPGNQNQRDLFYATLDRRIKLLRRFGSARTRGSMGTGIRASDLLRQLPLFANPPVDEQVVDPRRTTPMNIFAYGNYDPMLPMRERARHL